jgi:hypothetical protein
MERDTGRLEIRDRSDAVLEYAEAEWIWTRHTMFGWRNIYRMSEINDLVGVPNSVKRALGLPIPFPVSKRFLVVFAVVVVLATCLWGIRALRESPAPSAPGAATLAPAPEPELPRVKLTRDCNLRARPDSSSKALSVVHPSDPCGTLGVENGWTHVRCGSAEGWIGAVCLR